MRFVYGALLFAWSATAAFSLSPPVAAGLIILLAGTILPLIKQNTPPFGKQAVLLLLGWTFVLYLAAGWLSFAISGLFLLLALIAIKAPLHAMQEAALMYEKVRYSSATLTKKEAALFRKAVTEVKQAMQDETRFT
ncbi:hypothetical protein [Alkalicoccus luteus]|uniref:hypothetical protein n=1 Tax=Alkalicoccus luteus TaxID=1237094 RepID=UPI004033C844